jgi:hypothetical protein
MLNLIAMRTEELVPLTDTKEPTSKMQLTGVSRVHVGKTKSLSLRPILHSRRHQVEKPTVQLPASPLADVLLLGLGLEVQVLKDKNSIRRSPLTELGGGFLTERPVAVSGFPGQPFQHSADIPRVLVLCLLPGELGLQPGTNLASLGIADRQRLATDEERVFVCGSDQGVIHPEVDADWDDAFGYRSLDGDAKVRLAVGDAETINAFGGIEVFTEVLGDFPANLLPSLQCGDGQATVSAEREILGEKEERCRSAEDEWSCCWSAVGLGRSVGGSSCSDGIATHLRRQRCWSLMVDQFLQLKSSEGTSLVETDWADGLLVAVELSHGLIDESVLVKDYRYGSLNIHTDSIVTHPEKSNTYLEIKEAGNSSVS